MSPWWITASAVLVVAAALVGALAWRIGREVDHLTASVVALRAWRTEIHGLHPTRTPAGSQGWTSTAGLPR